MLMIKSESVQLNLTIKKWITLYNIIYVKKSIIGNRIIKKNKKN